MFSVFHSSFMHTALAASLIVGGVCAYLGIYVVLRRIVFVGAALAQVSSAGVGLALYLGIEPSLLSLLLTLGGVAAFSVRPTHRKMTQESFIGIGYAVASALAVLFVAKSAQGEARLLDVLSGNILTVTAAQVWWMAGVSAVVLTIHALFHKQFFFATFDPETAQAVGIKSSWWDLGFFLLLGVIVALGIRLAGTLLVFAFLVIPAVTALLLSRNMARIALLAVGVAVIATIGGLAASVRLDLPSGPTIVAVLFLLLCLAWPINKLRGG